jgi:hypothetical protein
MNSSIKIVFKYLQNLQIEILHTIAAEVGSIFVAAVWIVTKQFWADEDIRVR